MGHGCRAQVVKVKPRSWLAVTNIPCCTYLWQLHNIRRISAL